MRFRANRWRVHIRNTVRELVEQAKCGVHIPGINGRRQSVLHVIIYRESLIRILDPNDRKNRTEDLFLLESAARLDVRENRGSKEVALRQLRGAVSADDELRSLRLTYIDVRFDFSKGGLINERADVSTLFATITQLEGLRPILEHAQELVVHLFLNDQPARSRATLTGGAEGAP